jgi:protein-S-isoprenylcysteine O-methyltransferase Ste14
MSDIDDAIRQALSAEDRAFLERVDADRSLHRQVIETFQGRLRWFNAAGWIVGLALFIVAVVCGWHFASATELRAMLLWGAAGALAISGLALVKLWFWMELQKNATVREVKRLELQVANLAAALRSGKK